MLGLDPLYIDPGTGSYLVQVLAASFLALAYVVKRQWHRLTTFVTRVFGGKDQRDDHE